MVKRKIVFQRHARSLFLVCMGIVATSAIGPAIAQTGASSELLLPERPDIPTGLIGSFAMSGDGNTVVVSDSSADVNGENSGVVEVLRFDGVRWVQLGREITGNRAGEFFGDSVEIAADGNTIIVGGETVRAYGWDGSSWNQMGTDIVQALDTGFSMRAFSDVELAADGRTAIIGERFFSDINQGRVVVFDFDGNDWVQRGSDFVGVNRSLEDIGFDFDASALLGSGVAISGDGNTIAFSAPERLDVFDFRPRGRLFVFDWDRSQWVLRARLDDLFHVGGDELALSADGNTLAATSEGNGDDFVVGSTVIYRWDGIQLNEVFRSRLDSDALFGRGVDLSDDGNTAVVIGVLNLADFALNQGASVIEFNGSEFRRTGLVRQFTDHVALSGDGSVIGLSGELPRASFFSNLSRSAACTLTEQVATSSEFFLSSGNELTLDWADLPGVEQLRNASGWVANVGDTTSLTLRSGLFFTQFGGEADAGWTIRRRGVDEVCMPLPAPPDPGPPTEPPPSFNVCSVREASGGVEISWSDLQGIEQLRNSSGWVASVGGVTSFLQPGASVDDGWLIRRGGEDELCEITDSAIPPMPQPSGDECTVTATASGVEINWQDRQGQEQLRRATGWLASVPDVTAFTVPGGLIDEGWVIRRAGVDEVCEIAPG